MVAGIGNMFLGDDGFGSEVVRRLPPDHDPGVRVTDYGIRGLHLAYDLLDGWDALILVDAIPDRGEPGRVEVFRAESGGGAAGLDGHAMHPEAVFETVRALGGAVPPTVVVGCQVCSVDECMGLTDVVAAAVPAAVAAVGDVLAELLARQEV
ncbi:hydrogenase maturation protease [Nocardia sp. CA-151230]|uniref:hydrogenase maturation protease n=1 Tax=Nocardia sp. CA-151230 TaxID=3239982 RepID=UPI003D8E690F